MIQRSENKDEQQLREPAPAEAGSDRITGKGAPEQVEVVSPKEIAAIPEVLGSDAGPCSDEISGVAGQVEALLFVATEALSVRRMADLLGENVALVQTALDFVRKRHADAGSGIQLSEIAGGWRLLTRPEHADALDALSGRKAQDRLSPAALETLAIVAYRQPVSRAEIERIRGVGVGPILRHLLEIDLIKVGGREDGLGRALLYGTTRSFLDRFGLKSIKDLPASLEL